MTALANRAYIDDPTNNANAETGLLAMYDALNEATEKPELDIASASTCNIGAMASTKLRITGTTGITSFGTVYRGPILIRMAGALTITHNATTLVCPGIANLVTAAGDVLMAFPKTTTSGTSNGWQVVLMSRASATIGMQAPGGVAITGGSITGITDLAIADGGTGASTATAAFDNIKQAATESASGAVERATPAEVAGGVDSERYIPPAYLHMHPSVPKAWLSFNGTTGTILSQQNISSVIKNSTGNYTINFNLTFLNAAYVPLAFVEDSNSLGATVATRYPADTRTTTAFQFRTKADDGTSVDSDFITLAFFGYR